jgi:hypothetical protein
MTNRDHATATTVPSPPLFLRTRPSQDHHLLPRPQHQTNGHAAKAALRNTIGKEAGDSVHVRIEERIA